jgi:hypothetical protein
MNCRQCRKRLLASQRPASPPSKVQAHLAACQACRKFQRQLAKVEANVVRLPVPPSRAKAAFLATLRQPDAVSESYEAVAISYPPSTVGGRALAIRWGAVAAAAVVLIAVGIWAGSRLANRQAGTDDMAQTQVEPPAPKGTLPGDPFAKKDALQPTVILKGDTLVAGLMACDLKLAEAESGQERVRALTDMAGLLQLDTRGLRNLPPGADWTSLVGRYRKAIQEGSAAETSKLPIARRDLALILTLIDGGLKLAGEDDPLQRASYCQEMADKLAGEIKQAVQTNDAGRALQLGDQMNLLLVQGVAGNLDMARAGMEPNSPREPEIARVGSQVSGAAKTIEDEITRLPAPHPNMLRTLQAVQGGKTAVEQTIAARGKAKGALPKTKKK